MRQVSMYIKDDYVRQKMIDSVVDALLKSIPTEMFEPRILKHGVKLLTR